MRKNSGNRLQYEHLHQTSDDNKDKRLLLLDLARNTDAATTGTSLSHTRKPEMGIGDSYEMHHNVTQEVDARGM